MPSLAELQANVAHAASGGGSGVSDHGALTGLGDDDHPQYVKQAFLDGGSAATVFASGNAVDGGGA